MDTRTLKVGQKVKESNGQFSREGWVSKITPTGVEIQFGVMQADGSWNPHELYTFDQDGHRFNDDPLDGPEGYGDWYLVLNS